MQGYLFKRIDALLVRMAGARVGVLLISHALLLSAVFLAAAWVMHDFVVSTSEVPQVLGALSIVVAIQLAVGAVFGFYQGWWRYVSIGDAVRLAWGLTAALALTLVIRAAGAGAGWLGPLVSTRVATFVVDWTFAVLGLFASRITLRLLKDRLRPNVRESAPRRVLIVGAGDAGDALAREIKHGPHVNVTLAAFVDDDKTKWNSYIRGVPVRGPIDAIGQIARQTKATEALIAIPSAPGQRIREITQFLIASGLPFQTMPGLDQLMNGRVHVSQLRPVRLDDLLRRAPVVLPGDPVRRLFAGTRVVITGAGGTIGSELAQQVLRLQPASIDLVERSEQALYDVTRRLDTRGAASTIVRPRLLDVRDTAGIAGLLRESAPQIVVHAAAHKHVPLGEANPLEYLRNNCLAVRALAEAAAAAGVERFVFISTDKAVNPVSVMGATKRAAEIALLGAAAQSSMRASIVRFGNVIGSSGSVVPLFMEQIAAGGPVTVTHPDATRFFLRTSEAVELVLQSVALGDGGSVYRLEMGQAVNIASLARDMIRLSNFSLDDIEIVFTGLRPGEKLVEELHHESETVRPTVHPQIVVTLPAQPDRHVVDRWLAKAHNVSGPSHADETITLLRELVTEYQPAQTPVHQ